VLETEGVENPLFFKRGAEAEATARRLGDRMVQSGGSAVYLHGRAFGASSSALKSQCDIQPTAASSRTVTVVRKPTRSVGFPDVLFPP
jgi:hypothetical protein